MKISVVIPTLAADSALDACLASLGQPRLFAFSARATHRFDQVRFQAGDALLFGPETRGLPKAIVAGVVEEQRLCLPMRANQRSLNLSNAVAVAVYEAWRQLGFVGRGEG